MGRDVELGHSLTIEPGKEVDVDSQNDGAIQVNEEDANAAVANPGRAGDPPAKNDDAIRLIQGPKTHLADPHGIAV